MKMAPVLIHAASDYVLASLLLLGPWIFGFSADGVATAWTMSFGAILLGYSLFTDYEPSLRRVIPIVPHLALDGLFGGLLIGAPFMFGFSATTWIPHLVIGCVWNGIAAASALYRLSVRVLEMAQHRRGRLAH